jgi:hypothetical protein
MCFQRENGIAEQPRLSIQRVVSSYGLRKVDLNHVIILGLCWPSANCDLGLELLDHARQTRDRLFGISGAQIGTSLFQ